MARILLGVSGGIAAYKALELVRLATAAGHALRVVQTPVSERFVGKASFEALTGAPVLVGAFDSDPMRGAFPGQAQQTQIPIAHLALAEAADVYLIAPASANTISKLAIGLCDNLLCSCALAAACPLLIAPAMNNRMYAHPATQANLNTLRGRGVKVLEPACGRLASAGEHGLGRLQEPAALLAACESALRADAVDPMDTGALARPPDEPGSWAGLKVLISAGGTREPIDSVRFLGNSSSGKMGDALARGAAARGAEVTFIAANVELPPPPGVRCLRVETAEELRRACEHELDGCDILLMAAAVADFRPVTRREGKIAKRSERRLILELEPTADVLSGLQGKRRDGQTIVGFAAEHAADGGEQALMQARQKLREKRLDAIVFNDISREDIGFGADENEVTIIARDFEREVGKAPKREVAEAVLNAVAELRAGLRSQRRDGEGAR